MKPIHRLTALVIVVALSLGAAPRASQAGTPTAKTCYFVRNNLPCPCPNSRQARAVVHAARVTVGAVGNAIGTTAVALTRADRNHAAGQKH